MPSDAGSSFTAPAAAPVRRTLFKKPAYAKPSSTEQNEAINLFSRSKQFFPDVIRQQQQEKLKSRKLEEREKRRRSSEEKEKTEGVLFSSSDDESGSRAVKRRSTTSKSPASKSPPNTARNEDAPSKSTSPRTRSSKPITGERSRSPVVVYEIDSDSDIEKSSQGNRTSNKSEDDGEQLDHTTLRSVPPPPEPDVEEVEEFPELVAAARARAAAADTSSQARLAQRMAELRGETVSNGLNSSTKPKQAPVAQDPIIKFFIDSCIEDSTALMVRRKLSQRLRDVRLAWCDRQNTDSRPLNEHEKDLIFLTWRGHRLFDATTGAGLGLKISSTGDLTTKGDGFHEDQVHLQAWTDDHYRAYKAKLQEEKRKTTADPFNFAEEATAVAEPVVEETKIRVVLYAKEYPEVKLYVRPSTEVSRLILQFRKRAQVPSDKKIVLRFDGDELSPDSTVEDAEIEDDTRVDVYVV